MIVILKGAICFRDVHMSDAMSNNIIPDLYKLNNHAYLSILLAGELQFDVPNCLFVD